MANPFVHVELNTPEKAKAFYSKLFQWQFEEIPNSAVPVGQLDGLDFSTVDSTSPLQAVAVLTLTDFHEVSQAAGLPDRNPPNLLWPNVVTGSDHENTSQFQQNHPSTPQAQPEASSHTLSMPVPCSSLRLDP